MAVRHLPPKSKVRPARDPAAPWASNAARQSRESDGTRAVVYCIAVEGVPLVKIGRTTRLKKRMGELQAEVGRSLHVAYWAEFSDEDSKDIERCALMRMRRHFDSEGEWSLADPVFGAAAIMGAASFMGVAPNFEAGAPSEEDADDELAELRNNNQPMKKGLSSKFDRDRYNNLHWG